ncbi:uncharacterized protein LOC127730131 [Mytilus californianus]|uniref:uncharacterized protein LOC127730131 n=1 Tax=Mytilus californianus TaxID=6549 RepID=UPI0022457238|nr:uncharacterized protein LOC127730131 [Mytilus californianus]
MALIWLELSFFKAFVSLMVLLEETKGLPLINREDSEPVRQATKCQYKGTTYLEGSTINSGVTADGCKFALVCNSGGTVSHLQEPDCPRPTTTTTTLSGPIGYCFYNGHNYNPGQQISHGQSGNWCYSTYCSYDGQILNADNFNCSPKPTPITTIPVIQVG